MLALLFSNLGFIFHALFSVFHELTHYCHKNTSFVFSCINCSGHILHLYCIRLSNAAPFCENYAKLYFDAKQLQKGLNRGGGNGGLLGLLVFKKVPFIHKKVPFLANIKRCPKFLDCAKLFQNNNCCIYFVSTDFCLICSCFECL